ncbi:MAG: hypothetical protein GY945_15715 [Rhodobacteraceae bacterium]|nr:hypothetical protein [Paracoccaceae bacterium]
MLRIVFVLVALALLSACGADPKWASDEAVENAVYIHEGPTTLTLFTVISNRSGSGAHAGLLINGSQRVLFDPAGTWHHPNLPERNDVHFGITDPAVDFYIDYHSRVTYHTIRQDIQVSPEVAEAALRAARNYGAVPKAMCTQSISSILRTLPGFESLPQTLFPKNLAEAFRELPGVTEQTFYDDDPEENGYILVRGI